MQKIINVFAITSFVVSGAVVGSGLYVYLQRDKLVDSVKSQVLKSVTGSLGGLAGGAVEDAMPTTTGPAMPLMPAPKL